MATDHLAVNRSHLALPIRQLGCAGNVPSIEHSLRSVRGVSRVYVNPVTEMAYVEYDPSVCDETAIRVALEHAGYGPVQDSADRRRWM